VPSGILLRTIDFDQHKARWVIALLDHVKPSNARLLYALAGILDRGPTKGVHVLRFDVHINMNNQHPQSPFSLLYLWQGVPSSPEIA
jgi:hypothetical protein